MCAKASGPRYSARLDPDETAEAFYARFGQGQPGGVHMWEVPGAGDGFIGAVDVPAPAMKTALKFAGAAFGV